MGALVAVVAQPTVEPKLVAGIAPLAVHAAIGGEAIQRFLSTSPDAAKAAGLQAPLTKGSVVASDAFFPFADGLLVAVEAGATAVIQPGGSVRDDEVIKAADEASIAMVFTGTRHFRH